MCVSVLWIVMLYELVGRHQSFLGKRTAFIFSPRGVYLQVHAALQSRRQTLTFTGFILFVEEYDLSVSPTSPSIENTKKNTVLLPNMVYVY
jgi:hypothetical protein